MRRTIQQKLEKCKASIEAHIARGGTCYSIRGQALQLRYDDFRLAACDTNEWLGYCAANGLMPNHRGFDLFA